ncbi:alginate export family protein [Formicincola oecophyllae]|nr:alginate export family protein [Formicincola oecophyllae]
MKKCGCGKGLKAALRPCLCVLPYVGVALLGLACVPPALAQSAAVGSVLSGYPAAPRVSADKTPDASPLWSAVRHDIKTPHAVGSHVGPDVLRLSGHDVDGHKGPVPLLGGPGGEKPLPDAHWGVGALPENMPATAARPHNAEHGVAEVEEEEEQEEAEADIARDRAMEKREIAEEEAAAKAERLKAQAAAAQPAKDETEVMFVHPHKRSAMPPVMPELPPSERPAEVELYPLTGMSGQPMQVTEEQNRRSPNRHQGNWGAFNFGDGEFAGFGPVGTYGVSPWAEDWSRLCNPKNRKDLLDPLKYVDLGLGGQCNSWVTFSGESRLNNWYQSQPLLGHVGHQGAGQFYVRNLLGADFHFGPHFRVFGQLSNADAGGWNYYGYSAAYRQTLDVQQLFAEIKWNMLGAKTGLMLGRQQFLDAPSWLLYEGVYPGIPQSWNGGRYYMMWNSFRLDFYDFIKTKLNPNSRNHVFGGAFDPKLDLYGITGGWALPRMLPKTQNIRSFLYLYWLGFHYDGTWAKAQGSGAGEQMRQNLALRWYTSAKEWELDMGAVMQRGSYKGENGQRRPVHAYGARIMADWRPAWAPWHSFVGGAAELYSGGRQRRNGAVTDFEAPFSPSGTLIDAGGNFGRSNMYYLAPLLSTVPTSWISLRARLPFMWRQHKSGGLVSAFGPYALPADPILLHKAGRYIGFDPQLEADIQLGQHVKFLIFGGDVRMSKGMRRAGFHDDAWLYSTLDFRF